MSDDDSGTPVIDDVVIARLFQLRDQVARPGEDVLGELLDLFVQDTRVRLATIRSALASGDAEARRLAAHALKGSAGNVGASRVARLAASVEKGGATAAQVDDLENEATRAIEALRLRFAAPAAAGR
jgi:HPt (histidine-containing phosphotransfer) domain-containing protein